MTISRKAIILRFIVLVLIICFVILYFVITKVKSEHEFLKNFVQNDIIKEFNFNKNKLDYKDCIDNSDSNKIILNLKNGEIKEFVNDLRKFGENSFRSREVYKANTIINNYLLLDMFLGVMFDTVFVNLDNGNLITYIPSCENINENNFNRTKTMFFCYNYDKTNFSENGISIFFLNEKNEMKVIYDKEEFLNYYRINWISDSKIEVKFIHKNKINYYYLSCDQNQCIRNNN